MKEMGLNSYRLRLSRSRILPSDDGIPNPRGLAYCRALSDEVRNHGIQPGLTFFLWDFPQSPEARLGG